MSAPPDPARPRQPSPRFSGPMAVIVGLVVLALGVATVAFDLHRYLTLSGLKELHVGLSLAYAEAPVPVVLGFMGVTFLSAALSLPGATLLSLVAGAVFGRGLGLVVASVSATLGALMAMLMARYLLRDLVRRWFGPRLAAIDEGMARDGAAYLFALRVAPLFPFFLVNLAMGLTSMRAWTYTWVTQLGLLGGIFLYVNAGTELAALQSLQDLWSPSVVASLVLLGVVPALARRMLRAWGLRSAAAHDTRSE
ncbi:MAG: TVP38/TMEM64 family protein [Rubrivivax sp.]